LLKTRFSDSPRDFASALNVRSTDSQLDRLLDELNVMNGKPVPVEEQHIGTFDHQMHDNKDNYEESPKYMDE
jgi:hypothetical protein